MPRTNPTQTSFLSGELSPRTRARLETDTLKTGARQIENMRVQPHGGVARDPGTQFVAEVKNSAVGRLVEFIFSSTVAYVVEMTDLVFRFYTNEAQVDSGGPVEAVSPFAEADLFDVSVAQENDAMYMGAPNVHPHVLSRLTATSFSVDKVVFRGGAGPLRALNKTTTTLTPSATTGSINLTASSALWVAAEDVGRIVRVANGYVILTSVTSPTVAVATVRNSVVASATTDWALGMYSDTEGPLGITFHEGRLAYLGSPNTPDRYAISNSDDFDTFTYLTADNADAIQGRLVSKRVNRVSWGVSVDGLLIVGTDGGPFTIEPREGSTLTPTTARPFARGGEDIASSNVRPVLVGNSVHYIHRNGRKLHRFKRSVDTASGTVIFEAPDISLLSEHLLKHNAVIGMAYQPTPDNILWLALSNGAVVGYTTGENVPVAAGHRHPFGRTKAADSAVDSIAVIPAPDLSEEQVWYMVKRTINGTVKRFVEFGRPTYEPDVRT